MLGPRLQVLVEDREGAHTACLRTCAGVRRIHRGWRRLHRPHRHLYPVESEFLMSVLTIKDLHVSVETDQGTKNILNGVDLTINQNEIHAIMGPNGSGKSTLAYTIAGHPKYHVESGSVHLDDVDVLEMSVDERARADRKSVV